MSKPDRNWRNMEYIMVIREEPEGYSASFPDLPGCFTQGDTIDELHENAHEAVELYLDVLRDKGEPAPQPTSKTSTIAVKAS